MSFVGIAQVMPSPDASSMIKGINTPVNLYNGTISASIPLYEASANNGAKVPITLQYNGGGGIRVNESPSSVGLGWFLQAGGSITRVMRDQPDEHARFSTDLNYTTMRNVALDQRMYDFEKDLFYFTFPGGSGKFVFSADDLFERAGGSFRQECVEGCGSLTFHQQPACIIECSSTHGANEKDFIAPDDYSTTDIAILPSSDIKIQFNYRDKLNSDFVITDTHGNQYFFGQSSSAREITTTNTKDNKDNKNYEEKNERKFISTWHLTKIVYANQPESKDISFTYVSSTITEEQNSNPVRLSPANLYFLCMQQCTSDEQCNECELYNDHLGDIPSSPPVTSPYPSMFVEDLHNDYRNITSTQKTQIGTKYISTIRFPKGLIYFYYNNTRSDIPSGKSLYKVALLNRGGTKISETFLRHTYFNARDSYFKGGENTACYSVKCFRLKLDAVEKDGIRTYAFDYSNDEEFHANGADKFELPPRDSWYTDAWGYYNGGPEQGDLYTWHSENTSPSELSIRGMSKESNEYAKANILSTIKYASGGFKKFAFENHDFHGGVRIDTVSTYNENGQLVSQIHYEYEGEHQPQPFSFVEDGVVIVQQDRNEVTGKIVPHLFESSSTFVFDLNGPTAGYSKVTKRNMINGSYQEHEFITADDVARGIIYPEKFYCTVDTYQDQYWENHTTYINPQAFPYSTPTLSFFDRGLEKKVSSYDGDGKKVSEQENHYTHENGYDFSVMNHGFHLYHLDEDVGTFEDNSLEYKFIVSKYLINSRNINLDYSLTRNYHDDESLVTTTRTDYTYTNDFPTLPFIVKTETMDGSKVLYGTKKTSYYPFQKENINVIYSESILDEMVTKNMVGIPVQTISMARQNGEYLYEISGSSVTTFNKTNSLILPYQSYSYPLNVTVSPIMYSFDPNNFEKLSTFTYNSDGLLASQVGQDAVTTRYEYDGKGYMIKKTIDPGEASLSRSTIYSHRELVGLNYVQGPNGRKTKYYYDDKNRLKMIKNHENEIIKRYRYNYATEEQTSLSVHIASTGGYALVDDRINFSATISGSSYSSPKFDWVGNSSTSSSATYTWDSPGTKSVSVKVTDPEHPDVEKTDSYQLTVYESIADVVFNGPIWVRYCPAGFADGASGFEGTGSTETTLDYGSQFPYFGIGFTEGARCQSSGYKTRRIEYKTSTGSWTELPAEGYLSHLPLSLFDNRSMDFTFDVRLTYEDNCGGRFTKTRTIDAFVDCGSTGTGDGDGGDGPGGTGTSWTLGISPSNASICPSGEPSSASFSAIISGNHNCTTPQLQYNWEYKSTSSTTWSSFILGNTSSSINMSRSLLVTDPNNPWGSWDVRLTVDDGCGTTKTATSRISVLFDCSSGDGFSGPSGDDGRSGPGSDEIIGDESTGGGTGFDPSGNN